MSNRTGWILALACGLISSFLGPAPLRAQAVDTAKEENKAIKSMVEDAIGWYQVYADASAHDVMTPHPVLRWRNATRGNQESEGVYVLWVNNGRPEAAASIYPWEGELVHEFVSLSRGTRMTARQDGRVIWSPTSPGVEFKEIPDAPAPADTPAARLRQLKSVADRFKVTMTGWRADKSDREELRMLPKLIYRDEANEAPRADPSWIDGGVFAFVQGTDPEAILLLEVVRARNGRPSWRYAFARATAGGLEARLDKNVVWTVDFRVGQETPLRAEITLRRPLAATGSAR